MSPRAFDPMQRARDFPRMPSPRRLLLSPERRLDGLEGFVSAAIDLAVQPAADTPIEYVTELPAPTGTDLGRQIIVRLSGETPDTLYVGMLSSSNVVEWVAITSGDIVNSPEFSFVGHADLTGLTPNGIHSRSSSIRIACDGTSDVRNYDRATGSVTTVFAGYPSANTSAWGIHYDGTDRTYVAVPGSNWIEALDTVPGPSAITTSPVGHRQDFWGLWFDALTADLMATDFAGNQCQRINETNLQIVSTFATTGLSGPKGIATDASGNVFVADTGNNRIRKYNPSFVHQFDLGSLGTAQGQFNAPQGLAVDASDRLYVADSGNNRIQVFATADGAYLGKFGSLGADDGKLSGPTDVKVSGTLVDVCDRGNSRLSLWVRV